MQYAECDAVALWVEQRTCNSQVADSSPRWAPLCSGLAQATLHLCASVNKQCNLVLARGVISLAGKVTAGKTDTNGANHQVYG